MYSYADLVTPTNQTIRLMVTAGSVTIDQTADTRRSCSVTVVDPTGALTPLSSTSPLAPFGSVLKLYRGVKYTTGPLAGSAETVPLGVFRISQATTAHTGVGIPAVQISAFDLSRTIARDAFTQPYTISSGTNCVQAIQTLINRTVPNVTYDVFTSTVTTAADATYDSTTTPWSVIQTLAQAAACEVFFTATGGVRIAPAVDVDHLPSPVFSFVTGPDCTVTELDVAFTDQPGYNGVIVIGQSAGSSTPPVRSVAWDTNPNSATYYLGPYGQVPQVVTNSNVTTQSDADAAAASALNLVLGFLSQLSVTSLVNPALDVDDVVAVQDPVSGVNSSYAIQALTIPLDSGSTMSVTLRQKRIS